MKIAVIVLTFNSEKYLQELMESLQNTRISDGAELQIIFVDNASKDSTLETLNQFQISNFKFQIIENDTNLGFAGGNNVGMKYALDNGADYVALLNDDTVVEPEWIQESISVFKHHPQAGAVQSLLLYWDKKDVVNSWGNQMHFLGFAYTGGNLEKWADHPEKHQVQKITYASGAAVMYSAQVLKTVGLFDESHDMYHEDTDICLRMRLYGFETYFSPQSVVYHKYQFLKENKARTGKYKYYLMERNRMYVVFKYYLPRTIILLAPAWFVMEVGTMMFALMRGFWREKLRAYIWIVKNMDAIMRERSKLRHIRTCSDKELMHDFVSQISYQEINNLLLTFIGNPLMNRYWETVKRLM